MMHPVATTETVSTDGGLQSLAGSVVGIAVEQLDLSTRQAAASLFPKERGLLLLTLLFLQAEVQQMELDGSGLVDVAIIRLQSIEIFARVHSGWSKDTTLRSIAILEALQILHRHRHAEHTELHVPLIPWTPSMAALNALDTLLVKDAAREELQQLAHTVKERFLLLYGSPYSGHSDVHDLLNKRLSLTKRQLLQLRAEYLKTQLAAKTKEAPPMQPKQQHSLRNEAKAVTFHNKRAEVVALPATLTVEEWKMTLEYFHHKCAYCRDNDYQVLEHFIPLISGGGTTRYNCVPACVSCNSIKGDQHPSMLSPSRSLARTFPHIQTYLKTRQPLGEVDE